MDRYAGYYDHLNANFDDQLGDYKCIILSDIRRTHSDVLTQDSKDKMFRILHSYSKRNAEIGYCQGMNFMCYHFLELGFSEEQTFWILTYIFEQIVPKNYYINMVPVVADVKLFKHMLRVTNPELGRHLARLKCDLGYILIPWFIMAFVSIKNNEAG